MNDVDLHVTSWYSRDIEEVNMILSECHYGLVSTLEWRLFNVHPRERGAIGGCQGAHVQAE
jgi:hypothetical protein